jgi:hypothetical protein
MVKNIAEYLDIVRTITETAKLHRGMRWWFRGQSQDWSLNPKVYRDEFKIPNGTEGKDDEERRLRTERHLFREFADLATGLVDPGVDDYGLYIIQQHYGMPTRLLDWTVDPLVALYFATGGDEKEKGVVYVMDAYQMVHWQDNKRTDYGLGTFERDEVRDALDRVVKWQEKKPWVTLPLQVPKRDLRVRNQWGCFTLHVQPASERPLSDCIKNFQKFPVGNKSEIRDALRRIQVHPFRIYGDLAHLSETVIQLVCG